MISSEIRSSHRPHLTLRKIMLVGIDEQTKAGYQSNTVIFNNEFFSIKQCR